MASIRTIRADEFEREVLNAEVPVLVDFYADWCGPCRAMAPVLEKLADQADERYRVVKVDVDKEVDLAVRYEIRSIPMLLIFRDGEMVYHHAGFIPSGRLSAALEGALTGGEKRTVA